MKKTNSFSQIYRDKAVKTIQLINEPKAIAVFFTLLFLADFDERHKSFSYARVTYKTLMDLMGWKKTAVGDAVRYLIKTGFITKPANGCYRLESMDEYIKVIKKPREFVRSLELSVPNTEPKSRPLERTVRLADQLSERHRRLLNRNPNDFRS